MNRRIFVLVLAFMVCLSVSSRALADAQDTQRFRQAYESLNDQPTSDGLHNIVIEREASPEYRQLVELLYDWLTPYEGLDDPTVKRIYFPTIVFVRKGVVESIHIGTLAQQDDRYSPLEPELYAELVDSLAGQLAAVYP